MRAVRWMVLLGVPLPALAQQFAPPVSLNLYQQARSQSVAIDGAGNAIATWSDMPDAYHVNVYLSTRPPGGAWSTPAVAPMFASAPVLHSTPAGVTTAVWNGLGGVMSADRAADGTWSSPVLIAPGETFSKFVMNPNGDAVVAALIGLWYQGSSVWAVRRVGGVWGAPAMPGTPPAGANAVTFDDAQVGANGDALIVWESFLRTCGTRACSTTNYTVHATRGTGSAWLDSGPLYDAGSLPAHVIGAIDGTGRAAALFAAPPAGGVYSTTIQMAQQRIATGRWSKPVAIYTDTASGALGEGLSGVITDTHDNLSVVFNDNVNNFDSVSVIDGSLARGVWNPPVVLSAGTNGPYGAVVGQNYAGGGVVEWTDIGASIHLNWRTNLRSAWSARQDLFTLSFGCGQLAQNLCTSMGQTDVNPSLQAVTSFGLVTSSYVLNGGFYETTAVLAAVKDK